MDDIEVIGDKYIVFYKDSKIVFGRVFVRWNTNFTNYEGRCCVGFPYYDTVEEANAELLRYNLCKEEKCGNEYKS